MVPLGRRLPINLTYGSIAMQHRDFAVALRYWLPKLPQRYVTRVYCLARG